MEVLVSFLRGINVGGHAVIQMSALRDLYASLKFDSPQTYLQSGNVLFKTSERDLSVIADRIQRAIQRQFACSPQIMLRTPGELRRVLANNPFAQRKDVPPEKLLVSFLAAKPAKDDVQTMKSLSIQPEEVHLIDRELFIYFPNGMGKSRFPWARLDKILQTSGTGRNWNSVTKILALAEQMEASSK